MARTSKVKKRRSARSHLIFKPSGVIQPRVQAVKPEHFGIISVDCAKARSKFMVADFYGRVLVNPTTVQHTHSDLERLVQLIRKAQEEFSLRDSIVAIERTGLYHLPIKRAVARAGYEVRMVHPLTSKQFRQPANPGNKTDDTDLNAVHRAAVNGFGLIEHDQEPVYAMLQLLTRHRRTLVQKGVMLRNQIHEHLQAIMPGYSKCFDDIFECKIPLFIVRKLGSAPEIVKAGVSGLTRLVREGGLRPHRATIEKIHAWAKAAAATGDDAPLRHKLMKELDDDRVNKLSAIRRIEAEIVEYFIQTPYVLLLGIPGINVVSAAEFAGEMGPIRYYSGPRAITGRAGLFPSRYQSDEVDHANGTLVRCANRRLRNAIMLIADNLINCNEHFRGLAGKWQIEEKDERAIRVRVAGRFCRIGYHMVAGTQVYRHPSCKQRDYVRLQAHDLLHGA